MIYGYTKAQRQARLIFGLIIVTIGVTALFFFFAQAKAIDSYREEVVQLQVEYAQGEQQLRALHAQADRLRAECGVEHGEHLCDFSLEVAATSLNTAKLFGASVVHLPTVPQAAGTGIDRVPQLAKVTDFNCKAGNAYVTSYYTPIRGQARYFNGSYGSDYVVNCQGDCTITASGYKLKPNDANKKVACDRRKHKFGDRFKITMPPSHPEHPCESLVVECVDVGGAIKGQQRFDLWAGMGTAAGTPWIGEWSTRYATIEKIK